MFCQSNLTILIDTQRLHKNDIWCIYLAVPHCFIKVFSFTGDSRHLRFSMVQQFLSRVPGIRPRQFLFIWSEKNFLLKLYTTYPQKKPNHKKSHAYLTNAQYSTCLLKNCLHLHHCQSGDLKAHKMANFFFCLVSSLPSITTYRIPTFFTDKH